jgi:hypothetical protein
MNVLEMAISTVRGEMAEERNGGEILEDDK